MERKAAIIRIITLFFVLLSAAQLDAAPTTVTQAENVVRGWLKADAQPLGMTLGRQIMNVETYSGADEQPIYYVVYLQPSGFVIVPADDLAEPIIAFVEDGIYDPSPDNPLGALVSQDLPRRIAAVRELRKAAGGQSPKEEMTAAHEQALETACFEAQSKWAQLQDYADTMQTLGLSDISDVRVAPLVQSRWGQADIICNSGPGGQLMSIPCYNYYTPNHYPCGCVATAMAQLMRFYEYPVDGVGPPYLGGDEAGGPYNWDLMELFDPYPIFCITEEERKAIGALCYDVGVSVHMHYGPDGSSANMWVTNSALMDVFGYSNAVVQGGWSNDMVNTNLDAGYPTLMGVCGSQCHAVVCDGYGYNLSTPYHHINLGWGGVNLIWYNLPNIGTEYNFNSVSLSIFNVFRTGSGEIISGRVTYEDGSPVSGAAVSAQTDGATYDANTNDNGIYAVIKVPSNTTFMLSAYKDGYTFLPQPVTTGYSDPYASSGTTGNKWGIDFQGVSGTHPGIQLSAEEIEIPIIKGDPHPESHILSIRNCCFGTLNWEINETCEWLEVDPNSGDSTGEVDEITLSANITGMTQGSYNCELTISDPCAINSPQIVQVNLLIGDTLFVPSQYSTIQAAIDASFDAEGNIIVVAPGIYTGAGNRDLDFEGKAITVRSIEPNNPDVVAATVIDCQKAGRGFYFHNDEGPDSILDGLTIINGDEAMGGAIYCFNSSPTITNCLLVNNSAEEGGAICFFSFSSSQSTISNCSITNNSAGNRGGGIFCHMIRPTITNCTFSMNSADWHGGAVFCDESNPTLTNCILWGNTPEEVYVDRSTPVITYSDVQGGWSGDGNNNIDADPCFADPNGDYHLKSHAGRWAPSIYTKLDPTGDNFISLLDFAAFASYWRQQGQAMPADLDRSGVVDLSDLALLLDNYLDSYVPEEWVLDDVTSSCIDTGDPNSDWTAELWPHGKRINMGAFGGTPQASMSLSNSGNIADLDNSDFVSWQDLSLLVDRWLSQQVLLPEDLNRDGIVNFADFGIFAQNWLWEQ